MGQILERFKISLRIRLVNTEKKLGHGIIDLAENILKALKDWFKLD